MPYIETPADVHDGSPTANNIPKIFRTKTGHVEVSPSQLTIIRTGARGKAAEALHGNGGKWRTIAVYTFISVFLAYQGLTLYHAGMAIFAVFTWAFVAWTVVSLLRVSNFSAFPTSARPQRLNGNKLRKLKRFEGFPV